MRIAVCVEMRARLLAACADGGALAVWADDHVQALPRVEVGYRRPLSAADWPFVALLPVADTRDLIQGYVSRLTVAVACGVRSPEMDREGTGAQLAVDALAEAVVEVIADPVAYAVGDGVLVADTAGLTDVVLEHPHYQVELAVQLSNTRGV